MSESSSTRARRASSDSGEQSQTPRSPADPGHSSTSENSSACDPSENRGSGRRSPSPIDTADQDENHVNGATSSPSNYGLQVIQSREEPWTPRVSPRPSAQDLSDEYARPNGNAAQEGSEVESSQQPDSEQSEDESGLDIRQKGGPVGGKQD